MILNQVFTQIEILGLHNLELGLFHVVYTMTELRLDDEYDLGNAAGDMEMAYIYIYIYMLQLSELWQLYIIFSPLVTTLH